MMYTPNANGTKFLAHTTNVTRRMYFMFKFASDCETSYQCHMAEKKNNSQVSECYWGNNSAIQSTETSVAQID
jgi:hypothetical protein